MPSTADVVKKLMAALAAPDRLQVPDAILGLGAGADDDPEHLAQLARLAFLGWRELSSPRAEASGPALTDLARRSAVADGVSRHVRTTLDYLAIWFVAVRYFAENRLRGIDYAQLAANGNRLAALRGEIERCASELSTDYGAKMFAGMLASVHDRAAAAALFRAAREENPEFASANGLDHFAFTYLTEGDLAAVGEEIGERRAAFADSLEFLGEPPLLDEGGALLLFSCSRTFFVTYFPFWAAAVSYLDRHGVKLHFAFVAEAGEIEATIEDGLAVAAAASRLRGLDPLAPERALSFSRLPVPSYVGSATTLYACARYLLARQMAERCGGRVLIADMDMVIKADPVSFLDRVGDASQPRLPIAIARGASTLFPTRRFMANTFPVPRGEFGDLVMQHVEDYIYAGLSAPRSWALDQNALAYAVERVVAWAPDAVVNLGHFERPFTQVSINKLYEVGQRRIDESRS